MKENGFSFSAEKTALLVFTHSPSIRRQVHIKLGDVTINPSIQAKFLGVVLRQDLKWHDHVQHLCAKASRSVGLIKGLSTQKWLTPKCLTNLANTFVRSILSYGCEIMVTATPAQWLALERVELSALKHVLQLPRMSINDLVYQEVG